MSMHACERTQRGNLSQESDLLVSHEPSLTHLLLLSCGGSKHARGASSCAIGAGNDNGGGL